MMQRILILSMMALPLFAAMAWFFNPAPQLEKIVDGPLPRQHWFAKQRLGEQGGLSYVQRDNALISAKDYIAKNKAQLPSWQMRGPINAGGRVTDVVGHPTDPGRFYVATASGGLWKTEDGGSTLTPIFDGVGSMAIGAIGVDPSNYDTVYVGTGEANPGGGSAAVPGDGVWKTTNGGGTWTHLGLIETRYIGQVIVSPTNPNHVYVAAMGHLFSRNEQRGFYRSVDGGSTWSKTLYISDETGVIDIALDPGDADHLIAATWQRWRRPDERLYGGPESGIWQTFDGGITWARMGAGLPGGDQGRIGIAFAPSNPERVYAVYADAEGYFGGFFRSDDRGANWSEQTGSGLELFYSSYGWWFGRVFVDPVDEDEVWAVGVKLYASTNGGRSFSERADEAHVDHHVVWFSPSDPDVVINGNDGGVYRSGNGGGSFRRLNLPNMQFYAVEADSRGRVMGGLQDNGTFLSRDGGTEFESIYGGDGFTALFSETNPDLMFAEYQYGGLGRSTNGGGILPPGD